MIDKYRDKLDEKGVSPVIGVILLVAVTVALVALATVIVFDIGSEVSDTADATVDIQETSTGISVDVIRNENIDELRVVSPDGSSQTLDSDVGSSHTIEDGGGSYSIVATLGDGSEETIRTITSSIPYEIRTASDLQAIQEDRSANYIVVNDIDASCTVNWNNGQGFKPIGDNDVTFKGSFDGQNHTISNLSINRLDDNDVGLFGAIGAGGEVKNVGVINVNITGGESDNVGGLVGDNEGTVSNSYSTGNVTGDYRVGGLAGDNYGTVSNSYSTGNVTGGDNNVGGLVGVNSNGTVSNSYSTGNVTGNKWVGGLVGENYGTVSNSYSTGNVTGNERVGGLVGKNNEGTVSNSYSTGNVTGESDRVGGLVGYNFGDVSNSYWNSDSTITSTDVSTDNTKAGVPLTTSQMQGSSASSNMNFEFTSTWSTVTGDYPELQG